MARLAPSLAGNTAAAPVGDPLIELDRLLSRLQQNILRADAERLKRLRTSEQERAKASTNIGYARTLLTRLEQEALGIKILHRRQELQNKLNRNRDVIEQLTERIQDLSDAQRDDEAGLDDDDTGTGADDMLGRVLASSKPPIDQGVPLQSAETGMSTTSTQSRWEARDYAPTKPQTTAHVGANGQHRGASSQVDQGMRSRGRQKARDSIVEDEDARTTGTSATTAVNISHSAAPRSKLFGNRSPDATQSSPNTTEIILENERAEQDALTESMVKMASELKLSTLSFAEALEMDTEILNKTGEGLDKNERGMELAARRMGALAKMSEGTGWWGRIMLYVWIYGLMLFLVVLVFVMPKLRF